MDEMKTLITDDVLENAGFHKVDHPRTRKAIHKDLRRSHTPEEKRAEELRRVAFGASRRRPLTPRENDFAKALSVQPDKLPKGLPQGRVVKIVKEARRLWARRQELKRAGVPRHAAARRRAKAARKARRGNR